MYNKRKDNKGRVLRVGESQRPDGLYMYRYTAANGSRKTAYSWKLVATDKVPEGKKCEVALRDQEKKIQRDIEDNIDMSKADRITIDELFESFMEVRTDLRTATRRNYIIMYEKHIKGALGSKRIGSLRYSSVYKLYSDLLTSGYSASTIMTVHTILFQVVELAVMDGIVRSNPTTNAMKQIRKAVDTEQDKRHALTEDEQARFIEYVYAMDKYKRLAPLFTVLLGTGMRIGEAIGLRWKDCDFERNVISVNHALLYKYSEGGGYEYRVSEPKTKAGYREIPMFTEVKEALLQLKLYPCSDTWVKFEVGGYSDFIFTNSKGKPFTPAAIYDALQNIVCDYNNKERVVAIEEQREPFYLPKFSPHILRHTFCTRMCENETDIKVVQDVMGHKNIRTTMDVYNEATHQRKQVSFQNLEGKLKLA